MAMKIKQVEPGKSYYGVFCKRCETPIPVWDADPDKSVQFAGPGKLQVRCPKCRKTGHYETHEVQLLQAHRLH